MRHFMKAGFLAACGMASGLSAYAQQAEAELKEKPSKVKWRIDAESPLGGLGVYIGPNYIDPLSPTSALSIKATIGISSTYAKDSETGIIKTAYSPTAQGNIFYHRSFWDKVLRTSTGVSASYSKIDENFYGTPAIKGLSADFRASLHLFDEAFAFQGVKIPVSENLPHVQTTGITVTPFVRVLPALSGIKISFARTTSQFDYGQQQDMITHSKAVGYGWKEQLTEKEIKADKKPREYFVGINCLKIASHIADGRQLKGNGCSFEGAISIEFD